MSAHQTALDLTIALLAHQRKKFSKRLYANGECHFCGEDIAHANALFCDSYCCEDYERLQKQKEISGLM
ncbi:MAG: DUF2116 family Zn-ribbon domain-containing protein [Gammaproteobacteria bacterium]|nr:DUF2116 family Zn-ribbon domain-containing protein [Gammaproteobacteria bacterium]